ncbi:small multi-drug export protein [Nesterenkonia lacusekhoensis]|uniref:Membrane protein n=1 Tax=Nesterenkonia lacusekhoensis TaxID=150832 RepID=A0ABS4T6D0_9MICC|nr:small multi-drug export protein [Nesterenkonia lacusekhoensis]MBP2319418.1 putative membrane protein [Nesterenkonia lacusekhoensis]
MIESLPALTDSLTVLASTGPTQEDLLGDTWIGSMRDWADALGAAVQWLGVIAIGAIPLLEAYGAGLVGVLIEMPFFLAVLLGAIGNFLCVAVLVFAAHGTRSAVTARQEPKPRTPRQQKRREKAKRTFDRFGVPGVALLGPLALPSQFTAPLMVSFGANRNAVLLWMFVSIVVWAVIGAFLGIAIINLAAQ